jgi:endonuclease/exonuclease/phosphatase family metal-dependent hydrolase
VSSLVIASHNVMHGLRLRELLPTYRALAETADMGLLCVQENQTQDTTSHAEVIRTALGPRFAVFAAADADGLAIVYDHERLKVEHALVVALPKLKTMPRLAHLWMASSEPEQKYAQVLHVTPRLGDAFTLVNFHLDAAGSNQHRQDQLASVTTAITARGLHQRLVACGDANAFTFLRRRHQRAYAKLLSPLADIGAVDEDTRPTHFFARSNEPKWGQRLMRALGRFRFDMPRRYDVICTNLEVMARGQIETPDSDHDLLWARIALGST